MKEFEEKFGLYAIWRGVITEKFKTWLKNPESFPEIPEHKKVEREYFNQTNQQATHFGIPTDNYIIWVNKKFPHLAKKYPPYIEESVLYRGKIFNVKNRSLRLINLGIKDISEIEGIENLKELYFLNLRGNKIRQIKGIENLSKLIILNLSRNKIKEIKGLEHQIHLKELNLNINLINEINGLEYLNNLENLYLDKNNISEIKNLDELTNLSSLSLNKNEINIVEGIKSLKNLYRLELNYNNISEFKDMDIFPPNLKFIEIYHNPIPKEQYRRINEIYNIH